jgi:hypothetical protein
LGGASLDFRRRPLDFSRGCLTFSRRPLNFSRPPLKFSGGSLNFSGASQKSSRRPLNFSDARLRNSLFFRQMRLKMTRRGGGLPVSIRGCYNQAAGSTGGFRTGKTLRQN